MNRHRILETSDRSLILDDWFLKSGMDQELKLSLRDDYSPSPPNGKESRRIPTSRADLYAWHTAVMTGSDDYQTTDDPQCGWFKRRLVKGGVYVPARIWMYQSTDEGGELVADETLQCEVLGKYANAEREWPWLCGNPITESTFNFMMADLEWASAYAPHEPKANPRQPVNWLTVPTPTFER